MTTPCRLHYAPDNASLCVRLALEELGVAYETVLVDRAAQEQKSERYRRLNPNGLIPVLETPDGPIFETAAILLWLGDSHGALIPPPGAQGRACHLKWLFWLSNTLHPALRMLFYPQVYLPDDPAALRVATTTRIADLLDILEDGLPEWPQAPSLLHCYLAPMLRWLALYPTGQCSWFDLTRWPALQDLARAMDGRDAARRAAEAEGLGPTPFSRPSPANPPEGSAT